QTVQYRLVLFRQFTNQVGKMHELGIHAAHAGDLLLQSRKQLVASEIGKDWGATQNMHVGFGLGDSGKWKRRRIGYPMRRVRDIGQRPAATSRPPPRPVTIMPYCRGVDLLILGACPKAASITPLSPSWPCCARCCWPPVNNPAGWSSCARKARCGWLTATRRRPIIRADTATPGWSMS